MNGLTPMPAPVSSRRPTPLSLRRRIVPLFAGTSLVAIGGVVLFQVLRPEPAASQTREPRQTAQAPAQPGVALPPAPPPRRWPSVNGQTISYEALARECVNRHGKEVPENLHQQDRHPAGVIDQRKLQICRRRSSRKSSPSPRSSTCRPTPGTRCSRRSGASIRSSTSRTSSGRCWLLKKLAGSEIAPTEDDMLKAFEREYGPPREGPHDPL